MKDQLQVSLTSALHSTHIVDWEQVQIATSSDKNMLLSAIKDGFPEFKHQLPPPIREYHQFRKHLYSSDGVVIYKDRIVIPSSLRPTCLCPTCFPPGHLGDDNKSKSINLLAWHHERHTGHQSKLPALQQNGPIPGGSTTHTTHSTRVPIPVCMCRLLPLPRPHLPCHC